jgi:hypothetical protein
VRVVFQIGYEKNRKHSQYIKAYVNEEEISINEEFGKYLTTHKDRIQKGKMWFLADYDLEQSDTLKIDVKTFLPGIGKDLEKTFESFYCADDKSEVVEVVVSEVGCKGYPLVKGRVVELGQISEDDKRKADLDEFLSEGFD